MFKRCGVTTALAALELANAGPKEAQEIMREVGARSRFRLSQIGLEAQRNPNPGHARRRLEIIARRDEEAVATTLKLVTDDEKRDDPRLLSTVTKVQAQIRSGLNDVLGWLPDSENGGRTPTESKRRSPGVPSR